MANLVLNGRSIDTIDEIAENFVEEDVLHEFKSGSLSAWLEEYGYDEELERVKNIKPTAISARIVTSIADALNLDDDVIAENAARREEQQRKEEEIRKAQEERQVLANDNQENNKQHLQVYREGGDEKATEEISTGVAWKFRFEDGGLILEGLNNPQIISEKFNGHLEIPSEINGYKVIRIGHSAFHGNSFIKSVDIANGIMYISSDAFARCSSLWSVTIPSSVVRISSGAFYHCSSLTNVVIPRGVRYIDGDAFDPSCSVVHSEELGGTDEEVSSGRYYIDLELCFDCGACKDSCPTEAITARYPYVINQDKCVECGACVSACPIEAIKNFAITDDVNTWNNIDANLWNRIVNIIVDQLGVGYEQVTPDASFVDELGADSLDAVELIMTFEEEFGAAIPEEDAEKLTTVGKVYEYLSMHGYGTI